MTLLQQFAQITRDHQQLAPRLCLRLELAQLEPGDYEDDMAEKTVSEQELKQLEITEDDAQTWLRTEGIQIGEQPEQSFIEQLAKDYREKQARLERIRHGLGKEK